MQCYKCKTPFLVDSNVTHHIQLHGGSLASSCLTDTTALIVEQDTIASTKVNKALVNCPYFDTIWPIDYCACLD